MRVQAVKNITEADLLGDNSHRVSSLVRIGQGDTGRLEFNPRGTEEMPMSFYGDNDNGNFWNVKSSWFVKV